MTVDLFFKFFTLGVCLGLASGFCFHLVGRTVRRSFGLIGRAALMR